MARSECCPDIRIKIVDSINVKISVSRREGVNMERYIF